MRKLHRLDLLLLVLLPLLRVRALLDPDEALSLRENLLLLHRIVGQRRIERVERERGVREGSSLRGGLRLLRQLLRS